MDFNVFRLLGSGPRRKVYRFLCAKRTIFGDKFSFPCIELAQALGKEFHARPERDIKGAKKVGMVTCFAKYGNTTGYNDIADYEINDIKDILPIIEDVT